MRRAICRAKTHPQRPAQANEGWAKVGVGGINAVRQRPPTAKGTAFLAVEDKLGLMNIIVPKAVYERDRQASRAPFVIIKGRVQRADNVINVVADKVLTQISAFDM